jgi:hypothetical protein
MSESQTEPQKTREGCTYRTHWPLCIHSTGQWIPAGVIADLSDCGDASLRQLLRLKAIETADPTDEEPLYNQTVGTVKRKPCPCRK